MTAGDNVEVTRCRLGAVSFVGETGVITRKTKGKDQYYVNINGKTWPFWEDELKVVEGKQ